jgi:GDP-D-mannose 3',5'-epimerase
VVAELDKLDFFEMWGDGKQTRSFCLVDDAVEGVLRLMRSDIKIPLNIGSDEMVSMNYMANLALGFGAGDIPIKHIPGPEGVRGRNSENTLIKELLGWAPSITLADGLKRTYDWIKVEILEERAQGRQLNYAQSRVVVQDADALALNQPKYTSELNADGTPMTLFDASKSTQKTSSIFVEPSV